MKKYTKKQVESFCEDNFIEDTDWLYGIMKGKSCELDMETTKNADKNVLVIRISEL